MTIVYGVVVLMLPSLTPVTVTICGVSQPPAPEAGVKVTLPGETVPTVGVSLLREMLTSALGCEVNWMVKVAVVSGVVAQLVDSTSTPT